MPRAKKTITAKEREKIIDMVREGKTIKQIAKEFHCAVNTCFRLMHVDEAMEEAVEKARKDSALILVEKAQEVADDDSKDVLTDPTTGRIVLNATAVQRAKTRMSQLNKRAGFYNSKFSPNTRVDVTSGGEAFYQGIIIEPPGDDEEDDE